MKERILQEAEKYCRYEYIKLTYSIQIKGEMVKKSIIILMN